MRHSENPEFIESLARGLDVIRSLGQSREPLSLSEVAQAAGLARPTARRVLLTLVELGYVSARDGTFALTIKVLDLGVPQILSGGLWRAVRPSLENLVARTGHSCSLAQLDGSDVLYVARVAAPKLVDLNVTVGTRFPAAATSLGKVLLAGLDEEALSAALAEPSRAALPTAWTPPSQDLTTELELTRERGWAISDRQLSPAIRSVAAPVTDAAGATVAAINISAHALEVSVEQLQEELVPLLLKAAEAVSDDWRRFQALSTGGHV